MQIEKIILKNFRSHKNFTFEPELNGITSINGENGAGKSTIVDGFSWSLFGTRLHGLKNANYIRDGVDPKDEEVKVESYIRVNGERYLVRRKIVAKTGTTQCWVFKRNKEDSYEEVAGPTITHAEEFIRRTLGLDESGFLTSVFVQQKQVDQIISAGPVQRSKVIEKLIGIDALTSAIKSAKDESKLLQKSAGIVKRGNLEDLKAELEEEKQKIIDTENTLKELNSRYDEINAIKDDIQSFVESEEEKINEIKSLKRELISVNDILNSLKETLESDMELYNNLKKKSSKLLPVAELKEQYKTLNDEIEELRRALSTYEFQNTQDQDILAEILDESLLKKEKSVLESLEDTNKKIDNKSLEISDRKAEVERNKKHIKLLESGMASCPTCGSDINNSDNHKEESLKELDENENRLNEILKEKISLEESKKELLETIDLIDEQKSLKEKKELASSRLRENELKVISMSNSLEEKKASFNIIQKQLLEIKEEKEREELRSNLSKKIESSDQKISFLESKKEELKKRGFSLKDSLSDNYKDKRDELRELDIEFNQIVAKKERYEERVCQEKSKYKILHNQYLENLEAEEQHKNIIENLSIVNHAIENISMFREDRLYKSIPKLTDMASDILSRFTDGEFQELMLNEKFHCFVKTKDGKKRPVDQLSGGEMSAAAISLRFAISLFLSGMNNNLLILDEVLVSMSEERAMKALEVISSIKNTQIILIAHHQYASGVADKVVNL